jgi:hypothetical protein
MNKKNQMKIKGDYYKRKQVKLIGDEKLDLHLLKASTNVLPVTLLQLLLLFSFI